MREMRVDEPDFLDEYVESRFVRKGLTIATMYLLFEIEMWHSEKGKVAGYILEWTVEEILKGTWE